MTPLGRTIGLPLLALGVLWATPAHEAASQAQPDPYVPVAPPAAVHAGLASNLKIAADWLSQKDFGSTGKTAGALAVLAQLHGHQSADADWRARTTALRDACNRLAAAARARDRGACDRAMQDCEKALADLATGPPPGDKGKDGLTPFGGNAVWMALLDWAYADAKTARTAKEMEGLAFLLAEEANAVARQRATPGWREAAHGVRDAALAAAQKAGANDLPGARVALKKAYESCTACHEALRRP
jgi:hypothetical protein